MTVTFACCRLPVCVLVANLLVGVPALAAPDTPSAADMAGHAERLDAAAAKVQALIGAAACQHDRECHTAAWGAMACGGPAAYVPWSQRDTDAAALKAALAQHTKLHREQARRRQEASICMLIPDPGAVCVKPAGQSMGRCELLKGGDAMHLQ